MAWFPDPDFFFLLLLLHTFFADFLFFPEAVAAAAAGTSPCPGVFGAGVVELGGAALA